MDRKERKIEGERERYEVRERRRRGRLEKGGGGSPELGQGVASFNGERRHTVSVERERRRELSSLFL